MNDEEEIINDFVIEAKENLDSIEDDFLELERTQDNFESELVDKVFRTIHSIKGVAGFLNLNNITKLSHVMENLISKIREREIKPESLYVDPLLEGIDVLNAMIDDVSGSDQCDISDLIVRLEVLLGSPKSSVVASDTSENAIEPESIIVETKDLEGNEEKSTTTKSKKPSETIRIGVELLDKLMNMAGELVLIRNQQLLHVDKSDAVSRLISQRLDLVTSELQEGIMQTRMQPVGSVFGKFPRLIRDMSKKLDKKIEIKTDGDDVELDKTILESLADPLTHLIRNSCDHGIESPEDRASIGKSETSVVYLSAYHEHGLINIEIMDDGRGINLKAVQEKVIDKGLKTAEECAEMSREELANLITLPGLSTATEITDISGRGVGMDVVRTSIEKLGGTMMIDTREGEGTTILLKLPLTLAIIPSLLIRMGDEHLAIPQISIEELVSLYDEDVYNKFEVAGNQIIYRLRDSLLPMIWLKDVLGHPKTIDEDDKSEIINKFQKKKEEKQLPKSIVFAVLKVGNDRFGLVVDEVLGTEEIVVKPIHPALENLKCYSGATVLGDGKVALILDIDGVSQFATISYHQMKNHTGSLKEQEEPKQSVLLFKSGMEEQFAISLKEIKRIETIKSDSFEKVGEQLFVNIDNEATRVLALDNFMPVSKYDDSSELFFILPKSKQNFGLLASTLINIEDTGLKLNEDSLSYDGLKGSALVNEHITLFVDMNKIGEMAFA